MNMKTENINGATFYDSSPYANNGELIGGNADLSTDSPFRESISLDGNTVNEIDCGSDISLRPTSAITIETWVKHTDGGNGSTLRNVLRYQYGYEIQERADYKWRVYIHTENSAWQYAIDTDTIEPDVWYYIAGTYDAADGYTRLYVNGFQKGTHSRTVGDKLSYSGNLVVGNETGNSRPWYGNIAGVRITNRAKTAEEIRMYSHGF